MVAPAPLIETHPWEPFAPENAKLLIMGTFPPPHKRWSMDFYYPNRTNDFWFMMGLIFFKDRDALYDRTSRQFDLPAIKQLLSEKGIALNDTGFKIQRLKGNASDAFLKIVEPVDLKSLLSKLPCCHTIASTGEKAASVIAEITGTNAPKMGEHLITDFGLVSDDGLVTDTRLDIWRMPSTSRAYPLPLEQKASHYRRLFLAAGIPGIE